ncbi:TetR family transcriptional regulator [Aquincola sp. MAHUQ-54]|uniref:TetR family transcriptional regulator n=1 Tax=Aquincola agrisoli TaxID=3119538 RepID=A0AAW9Q756_9BURK
MVRKTKEDALITRNSILDAAELVFQRQGVSRTSLHDIAQAAGVTRGAVYWHFKDKADVFMTMMDRVCLPLEEDTGEREPVGPGLALEKVREKVRTVFRLVSEDERARRVIEIATQKVEYVDELSAVRDRHLQCRGDHAGRLEYLMQQAQLHGEIGRAVSPAQIALGLHALVDGLLQNWIMDPQAFDLVETGMLTLDTYLAGLSASRPA